MSKEKNINLNAPFFAATKNNATFVSIIIDNQRYPAINYRRTPWILDLSEDYLQIKKESGKNSPTYETIMKKARYGIERVELGVVRKMTSVLSMPTLLRIEIYFQYNADSFVLLCDMLSAAPKVIAWAHDQQIEIIDPFQLDKLFQTKKDPVNYIKENIHRLIDQVNIEKYTNLYVTYLENEEND